MKFCLALFLVKLLHYYVVGNTSFPREPHCQKKPCGSEVLLVSTWFTSKSNCSRVQWHQEKGMPCITRIRKETKADFGFIWPAFSQNFFGKLSQIPNLRKGAAFTEPPAAAQIYFLPGFRWLKQQSWVNSHFQEILAVHHPNEVNRPKHSGQHLSIPNFRVVTCPMCRQSFSTPSSETKKHSPRAWTSEVSVRDPRRSGLCLGKTGLSTEGICAHCHWTLTGDHRPLPQARDAGLATSPLAGLAPSPPRSHSDPRTVVGTRYSTLLSPSQSHRHRPPMDGCWWCFVQRPTPQRQEKYPKEQRYPLSDRLCGSSQYGTSCQLARHAQGLLPSLASRSQ